MLFFLLAFSTLGIEHYPVSSEIRFPIIQRIPNLPLRTRLQESCSDVEMELCSHLRFPLLLAGGAGRIQVSLKDGAKTTAREAGSCLLVIARDTILAHFTFTVLLHFYSFSLEGLLKFEDYGMKLLRMTLKMLTHF